MGIIVPFVRCPLLRRRMHPFVYYTSMVQQIKFIIHANIQPLPAIFFTQGHRSKVEGQGQRLKKYCLLDNLKNNYWISPNFLRIVTHEYGDHLIRLNSAFH